MSWTIPTLAAAYADRGWRAFPLHSPGEGPSGCDCRRDCGKDAAKHPRTAHGVSDATTNRDIIARWWRLWPHANIGIATGAKSDLIVLDVDPRSGGDAALATLLNHYGPLPATACVRTGGGGLHYYFSHPGSPVKNSAGKLGRGLDVLSYGGYVVAPPSVHVTHVPYTWAAAVTATALPPWLRDLMQPANRSDPFDTRAALVGVPEGERDVTLFRLACKLRRADVPQDVAELIVLRAAELCAPPFPAEAARRKVASAYWRLVPGGDPRSLVPRSRGLVNLR